MEKQEDLLSEIQRDFHNPKKKRVKREKKVEKKVGILTKIKIAFVLLVVAVIGVAYMAETYVGWRAEHQWQFPAVWVGLIRTIDNKVSPEAFAQTSEVAKTDEEILSQYRLSPVVKSIYMLESTSGQNDGCKEEGKVNGFGYRQNSREFKCYDNLEEVADKVNEWFEDRLSTNGNNLIEAVCYYNTGREYQDSCGDYSANFWSVITNYF